MCVWDVCACVCTSVYACVHVCVSVVCACVCTCLCVVCVCMCIIYACVCCVQVCNVGGLLAWGLEVVCGVLEDCVRNVKRFYDMVCRIVKVCWRVYGCWSV